MGLFTAWTSNSQALQRPASTNRIARLRLKRSCTFFSRALPAIIILASSAGSRDSVTIPVLNIWRTILIIFNYPVYRSCPEYDWLKLLLHRGKSGTMLPFMACSMASQLTLEGSLTLHLFIPPSPPHWTEETSGALVIRVS